ncbi:UNKNOWN [Stylonychia lemnae]|uniref:Uncharacterized protein n=1 Tax=Stylonychia lemnae TaxID=5949 RepID=A0A077ZYR2_STYLE|nr:UNKNOWN [Stylonychia lemnae]|eukprot:CDW75040.1 UNKNOWN [Stylonychia lemnae]
MKKQEGGYQLPDDEQYEDEEFEGQDPNMNVNQMDDEDDEAEEEDGNNNEGGEDEEDGDQRMTPGNAANGYDNIEMNQNFQYPILPMNGLIRPQTAAHPQFSQGRLRPNSGKSQEMQLQMQMQSQQTQQHLQNFQPQPYTSNQQQSPITLNAWSNPQMQMQLLQQQQQMLMQQQQQQMAYTQMQQYQQPLGTGGVGGFFQQNSTNLNNISFKRRPNTGTRKNHLFQFGLPKKSLALKNGPSIMDSEMSRMRVQIMEQELNKKDRYIDDLISQQDSYQIGGVGGPIIQNSKVASIQKPKLENHLTLNLKRIVRELQLTIDKKQDEIDILKKNFKSTKLNEMEVELQVYIDECTRMRHQLEEVIKSKDTFADPEELKVIEEKFQQQEIIIAQLRNENNQLALAFGQKDQEALSLRELVNEYEKKSKLQKLGQSKDNMKVKKQLKDRERDLKSLRDQVNLLKIQNEELKNKLDDNGKKGIPNNYSNKPQVSSSSVPSTINNVNSLSTNQNSGNNDTEVKRLRLEIEQRDSKLKEQSTLVQNLQQKLQEKVQELGKESQEKEKFRGLYEKYQDLVVQLQTQLEDGGVSVPKKQNSTIQKSNPEQQQKSIHDTNKSQQDQLKASQKSVDKLPKVDPSKLSQTILALKLKLQSKAFKYEQLKDFFFKPYQPENDVSIKFLSEIFDSNGIEDKQSLLLARYLIEPSDQSQVIYDVELSKKQKLIVTSLSKMIGQYQIFNDQTVIKQYQERIAKALQPCKESFKECLQMEDYEEEGILSIGQIKECFETLELLSDDQINEELFDYLVFVLYQKSEGLEKLSYPLLFELIEGKLLLNQMSVGSEGVQSRKRPESSSPQKIKARNKGKLEEEAKQKKETAKIKNEDEQEENYEEEFEQLLDKDDEDNDKSPTVDRKAQAKVAESEDEDEDHSIFKLQDVKSLKNMRNEDNDQEDEDQEQDDEDDNRQEKGQVKVQDQQQQNDEDQEEDNYDEAQDNEEINEEQMLDVAERCFVRIAEAIIKAGLSVRDSFANFLIVERIEDQVIELLSPIGFLEGVKDLGITDLEELEVACLMRVLTKEKLDNAIMLKELIVIMENFGIQDDEGQAEYHEEHSIENENEMSPNPSQSNANSSPDKGGDSNKPKKKKKKKEEGGLDLNQLDKKSIKILAKLILALMELNVSLYDFFGGAIYEQQVKTKSKQNIVELINAKDFFRYLRDQGVRKRDTPHQNLQLFLCLDPNYSHLLMLKKIARALDNMAKNEEIMANILADVDNGDLEAAVHPENEIQQQQLQQQIQNDKQGERLGTIGEDGDEDLQQHTNKNQGSQSMQNNIPNYEELDDEELANQIKHDNEENSQDEEEENYENEENIQNDYGQVPTEIEARQRHLQQQQEDNADQEEEYVGDDVEPEPISKEQAQRQGQGDSQNYDEDDINEDL